MEVHPQTCQACGSIDLRNIIARQQGRAQMVYVRCAACGELVARYRLSDYYHHGKGIESFLDSVGSDASDSGRDHLGAFRRLQEEALEGYHEVLEQLEKNGKVI